MRECESFFSFPLPQLFPEGISALVSSFLLLLMCKPGNSIFKTGIHFEETFNVLIALAWHSLLRRREIIWHTLGFCE